MNGEEFFPRLPIFREVIVPGFIQWELKKCSVFSGRLSRVTVMKGCVPPLSDCTEWLPLPQHEKKSLSLAMPKQRTVARDPIKWKLTPHGTSQIPSTLSPSFCQHSFQLHYFFLVPFPSPVPICLLSLFDPSSCTCILFSVLPNISEDLHRHHHILSKQ